MPPTTDATIRLAGVADLEAIRAIYNYYVERSTCTYQLEPDTEQDRLAWFQQRTAAHPVTVAEWGQEVLGWASLSPWKPRGGYARSVEASVYIRHDCHRLGLGRALALDLIERAKAAGHHTILGGACTTQTASLALQESLGFVRVAHLREVGYKFGRWLDVVYTQLILTPEG
ncbi:GNAT family N-acetyltransferase [Limnoglobus roseus]|uniref:N-acetyltransferase n=1 Tax=Limnoglobus roseus TaxID=2598579 RepID=A0A5C1AP15_9BACT|nr:GNAT family N-acetyltransferase [Limnoglobus roseus]QEL19756.1 N-acetyltransferase [Limnoglobus roseus]